MKLALAFMLCAVGAFAQAPPLPPEPTAAEIRQREMRLSVPNTVSNSVAVFSVQPPTNSALPFDFWTRQSGDWTLVSIATRTNASKLHVAASVDVNFRKTNAEWIVAFTNWPATQHLNGFGINDGRNEFKPPPQMFYKVTIIQ